MNNNPDQNSTGADKASEKPSADKRPLEDRRQNSDKEQKRGGKDDTVLGQINDE